MLMTAPMSARRTHNNMHIHRLMKLPQVSLGSPRLGITHSRYKLMDAIMYSSGEYRLLIIYVSYTMYPLKSKLAPPA